MRARRGNACRTPDGVEHRSHSAAARALGVPVGTVQWHMSRYGNLDLIGVGVKVPLSDGPRHWESGVAAAADLGVSRGCLSYHLARYGHLRHIGRKARSGAFKTVTIGGISWKSRKLCAEQLGVSIKTLRNWLAPTATREQRERLDRLVTALMGLEYVSPDERLRRAMVASVPMHLRPRKFGANKAHTSDAARAAREEITPDVMARSECGMSARAIARDLNVSPSLILRILSDAGERHTERTAA